VTTKLSKRFLHSLQLVSAFFGIVVSIYLLVQHTRLKSGIQGSASFCALGRYLDCDVVSVSPYSTLFEISLAGIGALYYFILLLFSALSLQRWIKWLAMAGLAVDLVLLAIQVVALKNLCLFCFVTYVVTFLILYSSLKLGESKVEKKPAPSSIFLAVIATVSFIGVLFLLPPTIRSGSYQFVDNAIIQFYAQWKEKAPRAIDANDGDGTLGDPGAKVRIVEFSDFECPFCKKAAFTLHTALKAFGNRVYFIFKNFPLDSECNPSVNVRMHPNACKFARLAYCAAKKGNFWEYHDLVFMKLEDTRNWNDTELANALAPIFSGDEVSSCLTDPKSLENVSDSISLANSLGVKGTPSIFINGKPVTIPLSLDNLKKLIDLE